MNIKISKSTDKKKITQSLKPLLEHFSGVGRKHAQGLPGWDTDLANVKS